MLLILAYGGFRTSEVAKVQLRPINYTKTSQGQWALNLTIDDHKAYKYIKDNKLGIEIMEAEHVFCPVRLSLLLLELRGYMTNVYEVMVTRSRIDFDGHLADKYLFIQQSSSSSDTFRVRLWYMGTCLYTIMFLSRRISGQHQM